MQNLFRISSVGVLESVASNKEPGKTINRRTLVLQEMGGTYSDAFVCTAIDKEATMELKAGQIVVASLRFSVQEYNGKNYQDCFCRELIILK